MTATTVGIRRVRSRGYLAAACSMTLALVVAAVIGIRHGTREPRTTTATSPTAPAAPISRQLTTSTHNTVFGIPTRRVAAQATTGAPIEPRAGTWRTWVLSSADQFRLPPPPDEAATAAELRELKAAARDPEALARIRYWDAGAPGYRWGEVLLELNPAGANPSRPAALLNIAIYDATVAAWAAKNEYNRPRPGATAADLETAVPTPHSPSYPSEHAVAAGAAAAVLGYLFPNEAQRLTEMAEEAARSRVEAGVQYPSDAAAGLDLGRQVADLVIERARADGSAAPWTGSIPEGPGRWSLAGYPPGATPAQATAATWKTWVLTSGDQFRPGPPPAAGSEQLTAELHELKSLNRTFQTNQAAFFWHPLAFPRWLAIANQKIFEYRLDSNPPRAARVYALASIADYDTLVACFDAKYHYWQIRPFQLDPAITTLFPTPAHPSYPAAHGCLDGAWETVLAYLFPREAAYFRARAEEAANSRVWAGIHFRSDIEAGLELGRTVGRAVIARARSDGAE